MIQTKLEIICLLDPRLDGCEVYATSDAATLVHPDGWSLCISASDSDSARTLWNRITGALNGRD